MLKFIIPYLHALLFNMENKPFSVTYIVICVCVYIGLLKGEVKGVESEGCFILRTNLETLRILPAT